MQGIANSLHLWMLRSYAAGNLQFPASVKNFGSRELQIPWSLDILDSRQMATLEFAIPGYWQKFSPGNYKFPGAMEN